MYSLPLFDSTLAKCTHYANRGGVRMFCRKCGKQIPDDAVFCPGCGTEQDEHFRPEADEQVFVVPALDGKRHVQKEARKFNPSSPALLILSIGSSIACAIMLLLSWIVLHGEGYYGDDLGVSVFKLRSWIINIYNGYIYYRYLGVADPFNIDSANSMTALLIILWILCMLFYVVSIYQLAIRSHKCRTYGAYAMGSMLAFFLATLGANNYMNSHYIFSRGVALSGIAYIAPALAVINYFAFIRPLTKR